MLASSFSASRPRDATRRMSATELVCAAPSQQRLRRSSVGVALQPSTQLVVFVASLFEVLLAAPRGHEEGCSSTSRRDAAAPRGGGRAARSISSVAAASAPSQQQKQATAASRGHERSTGLLCGNATLGSPSNYLAPDKQSVFIKN